MCFFGFDLLVNLKLKICVTKLFAAKMEVRNVKQRIYLPHSKLFFLQKSTFVLNNINLNEDSLLYLKKMLEFSSLLTYSFTVTTMEDFS